MFRKGFASPLIAAAATAVLWVGSVHAQLRTASLQSAAPALVHASKENRVALMIGNAAYLNNKPLNNPANDAQAVAQLLNSAGFEVVMAFDLGRDVMKQTVGEFAARIAEKGPNTVALVYYAGHGLQVDGENYLVPVDARFDSEAAVVEQGVKLAEIMGALEAVPSRMRIVILDACRNNPFGETGGKGLAIVDAPSGSIVAYSTAPGTEAFDGAGRHSPYAAAFMRIVKQPNMPIEQVFKRVRVLVHESTNAQQTPWESSSLTQDFVFFTAIDGVAATPAPVRIAVTELAARPVSDAYEIVAAEDSAEYYEEFVRLYSANPLCDHIRRLLARRQQMIAWQSATRINSPAAYAGFVSRFGDGDLVRPARRLQEHPRIASLDFPRKGEGRFGNGSTHIGNGKRLIDFPRNSGAIGNDGNKGRVVNLAPKTNGNDSSANNARLPQNRVQPLNAVQRPVIQRPQIIQPQPRVVQRVQQVQRVQIQRQSLSRQSSAPRIASGGGSFRGRR